MTQTESELSKELLTLYSNLALGQAWLHNFDELVKTEYFKHSTKQAMKRACEAIEKHTGPLSTMLHNEDDDSEIFNTLSSCFEYLVNVMAHGNPSEIMRLVHYHQNVIKNEPDPHV